MLHHRIVQHHQKLLEQKSIIQKQLQQSPDGQLICCQNGKYQKWYHCKGRNRTIIPKSNRRLAEDLAIKKYYSLLSIDLQNELSATEAYLQKYPEIKRSDQLLQSPGYFDLLQSYFSPLSEDLAHWMKEEYEQNPKHPEHLIHRTLSHHLVRSKSESMIDSLLFTHHIPFRYECALHLGELTFYPDFTIRHPRTGQIYYWEHFGIMDDPNYAKQAISKLQHYVANGIIPSIHLIITFETQEHPLTYETIQDVIEHYFL